MLWRARESSREAPPHAADHQRRFLLAARTRSPAARAAARAAPAPKATNLRGASARPAAQTTAAAVPVGAAARPARNSSARKVRWSARARLTQASPAMLRAAQAPASIPLRRSGIGV